jgi:hypothetical protein
MNENILTTSMITVLDIKPNGKIEPYMVIFLENDKTTNQIQLSLN